MWNRDTTTEPFTESMHSGGYHDFYEGYSEIAEIGADGNRRIKRVYTGNYYGFPCNRGAAIRGTILAIYLLAVVSFVIAGVQNVVSQRVFLADTITAIELILMLVMARTVLFMYLYRPPYTLYMYRLLAERLPKVAAMAGFLDFLNAVVVMILFASRTLSGTKIPSGATFVAVAGYLASAGLLLLLNKRVSQIPWSVSQSDETRPRGSSYIRA